MRLRYVDRLRALAALAAATDRATDAARLLATIDRARTEMGYPRRPVDNPAHDALAVTLRGRLGDDAFESTCAAANELSLDDAVAFAVARVVAVAGRQWVGRASRPRN